MKSKSIIRLLSVIGILFATPIVAEDNKIPTQEEIKVLQLLAEKGDVEAQLSLGKFYLDKEDYQTAEKWFLKSAKQGNAASQNYIASMYYLGEGKEEDNILAYAWTIIAAKNGDEDAKVNLKVLKTAMTPEEIAKAKQINPLEQE